MHVFKYYLHLVPTFILHYIIIIEGLLSPSSAAALSGRAHGSDCGGDREGVGEGPRGGQGRSPQQVSQQLASCHF